MSALVLVSILWFPMSISAVPFASASPDYCSPRYISHAYNALAGVNYWGNKGIFKFDPPSLRSCVEADGHWFIASGLLTFFNTDGWIQVYFNYGCAPGESPPCGGVGGSPYRKEFWVEECFAGFPDCGVLGEFKFYRMVEDVNLDQPYTLKIEYEGAGWWTYFWRECVSPPSENCRTGEYRTDVVPVGVKTQLETLGPEIENVLPTHYQYLRHAHTKNLNYHFWHGTHHEILDGHQFIEYSDYDHKWLA